MSDLVGNPEDRFSHNEAHICKTKHFQLKLSYMYIKNFKTKDANTVDPVEAAHYEIFHLSLQRLQMPLLFCLVLQGNMLHVL